LVSKIKSEIINRITPKAARFAATDDPSFNLVIAKYTTKSNIKIYSIAGMDFLPAFFSNSLKNIKLITTNITITAIFHVRNVILSAKAAK
jgi:hypothetical protein